MKLKAAFYEKFYRDHFYPAVYADEHKKMPAGDPGSDIWTKRFIRKKLLVYLAPYYFSTGRKYYYDLYQEATDGGDIWINNVDYFKALLFVFEADKEKYSIEDRLSFTSLFDANKKHKGNRKDAFDEAYFLDTLEDLHCLFAQKNLPNYIDDIIERKSRRKLAFNQPIIKSPDNILSILDEESRPFYYLEISQQEKDILYRYIFDQSRPLRKRFKAIEAFSIFKILSDEEIINLFFCPVQEVTHVALFYFPDLISENQYLDFPRMKFLFKAAGYAAEKNPNFFCNCFLLQHLFKIHLQIGYLFRSTLFDNLESIYRKKIVCAIIFQALKEGDYTQVAPGMPFGKNFINRGCFSVIMSSLEQDFPFAIYEIREIIEILRVKQPEFCDYIISGLSGCSINNGNDKIVLEKIKKILNGSELEKEYPLPNNFLDQALIEESRPAYIKREYSGENRSFESLSYIREHISKKNGVIKIDQTFIDIFHPPAKDITIE